MLRFVAGALVCNGLPHLLAGVQGAPFPTPFADPPARGDSPPVVNLLWGTANLVAGLSLLRRRAPALAPTLGFGLMGVGLAWHFGRVRAGR